jgi:hypothetical protein
LKRRYGNAHFPWISSSSDDYDENSKHRNPRKLRNLENYELVDSNTLIDYFRRNQLLQMLDLAVDEVEF